MWFLEHASSGLLQNNNLNRGREEKQGHRGQFTGKWRNDSEFTFNCKPLKIQLREYTVVTCGRKRVQGKKPSEANQQRKNKAKRRRGKSGDLPSRCSSTLSGAFISLGSFLSEQEKGNGDIKTESFFNYTLGVESHLGIPPKESNLHTKQKKSKKSISPSQTGQHLSSGCMVREQVSTGQMTGSQITVRFYRETKCCLSYSLLWI